MAKSLMDKKHAPAVPPVTWTTKTVYTNNDLLNPQVLFFNTAFFLFWIFKRTNAII